MSKKFTVEEQIRLQGELQEMVEEYGLENVLPLFQQYIESYEATQKLVDQQPQPTEHGQDEAMEREKQAAIQQEPEKPKIQLPPTVHGFEDYIQGLNEVVAKGQIGEDMIEKVREFVDGLKSIYGGDLSNKDFIMSLTVELFQDRVMENPYEEWIGYNTERVRKYLKRHLRAQGYQFLDSEAEVGKYYNAKKHNCVKTEPVRDSTMDGRVLKVISEGLIIGRILHINCNVIVGKYLG
jgi:hypothetical protein